jgi:hypothetical protein
MRRVCEYLRKRRVVYEWSRDKKIRASSACLYVYDVAKHCSLVRS